MTPLEEEIRKIIQVDGPIPVSRYMALCLGHPKYGYYMTRDPFGANGDFITAPEVSQMFGELVGLWCAETWKLMGEPKKLSLVELGPGRGTLMLDLLRAAKVVPEFRSAIEVHLVETSPKLMEIQRDLLQVAELPVRWHQDTSSLPRQPLIAIANEFVDALPIDQFIKMSDGWHEWRVGIEDDRLVFGASPVVLTTLMQVLPTSLIAESTGAIFERRDYLPLQAVAHRIADFGGAALLIDYGYEKSSAGDSLQAIGEHKFISPLDNPGEGDITSHVDFESLGIYLRKQGVKIQGPVTQGNFLRQLGIKTRAASLKKGKDAVVAAEIQEAMNRLISPNPGMGDLFKVMAASSMTLPPLSGFDS